MPLFKRKEKQNPWTMRDPNDCFRRTVFETHGIALRSIEDYNKEIQDNLRTEILELKTQSAIASAEEKSKYALEIQKERTALQSKLETAQRNLDLAYVQISELQSSAKGVRAEEKAVYDMQKRLDAEKIAFLTRGFEESQRALIVAQKEIVDLRNRLSAKEEPRILKYEIEINELENAILRWKDEALRCYAPPSGSKRK